MSSRRNFLGKFLTFVGVAAIPTVTVAKPILPDDLEVADQRRGDGYCLKYKGFRLFWTGWKHDYNTVITVGQWVAYEGSDKYDPSGRHFYASYPGREGRFYPGQLFDISVQSEQKFPLRGMSEADKRVYVFDAFSRLIRLIDNATKS
jgi:hypothetical protein